MTTYLHRNVEVIPTGRIAVREKPNRRNVEKPTEQSTLHEVKPKDPNAGNWTDWVTLSDLYVIKEQE